MDNEQVANSLEGFLRIIAEKTVETNNILRAMDSKDSNPPTQNNEGIGSGTLSSLEKFKNSIHSLGITLSSRDRSGKFIKGGSDTAIQALFRTMVNEQKKTIKVTDNVKKSIDKFANSYKSYSQATNHGLSKYMPAKESRQKMASYADMLTGGRKPIGNRELSRYIGRELKSFKFDDLLKNPVKHFGKLSTVVGSLLGNAASGALISKPKTLTGKIGGVANTAIAFEVIEGVKQIGTLISDTYKGIGTGIAYSARGGNWTGKDTARYTDFIRDARLMGYEGDEAREKVLEYQKLGLTMEDTRAGMAVSKAFGIENVAPKIQQLKRRTDAVSRFGTDLSKAFGGLTPLVKRTGLSLNELTDASLGFINSVKGQVSTATVTSVMDKYGGFVRRGDMSWGDVSNIYNKTQDVSAKGLMIMARYASMGGFKFNSDSYAGQAFELRHLQDPAQRASAYGAALRARFLESYGTTNINSLSNEDLFRESEFALPTLELSGLERLPNFKNIIDELMNAPVISAETQKQISSAAAQTDAERIATALQGIEHPVRSIHDLLYTKLYHVTGGDTGDIVRMQAKSLLEQDQKKWVDLINAQNKETNVSIINERGIKSAVESTPGSTVKKRERYI